MPTGLENELLNDSTVGDSSIEEEEGGYPGLNSLGLEDVKEAHPELDFLDTPAYEWTPDQRSAYNFMLSYLETGDWWARSYDSNYEFDPSGDFSGAFDIIGIEQPAPATSDSVVARYDAENGEGAFAALSWSEQRNIMQDNHLGWKREDYHNLADTLGNYDADGFGGYDEDATYLYAYGLEDNGNSGYQNLRPWDVQAEEMTTADLREIYNNDSNLQGTFGSEDDFLNYVAEMNYAGFGDIYGEDGSTTSSQDYYQNPVAQDIFERYASTPEGLSVEFDYVDGYTATNEMGDTFKWTGSQWMPFERAYRPNAMGQVVKLAVGVGLGLATGQAAGIAGAAGGLGGTVSGAMSGALGSAVSQGVITGSVDASSLLQAAILGGIGGFADSLKNMDSAIANGGILGTADDIVNATSELLGMPYDEALALLEGVITGAVSGGDLESIVAGAVGTWGESKIMGYLKDAYGDTLNVDDWFKDGESHIPIESLEPIIGGVIEGITNGTLDDPEMWGKAIWDYFQAGGDIDFMLPDGIGIGEWFEGSIGCPEWAKTKQGNCLWDGIKGWDELPDVLECMPGFDFDEGLRQCLPIQNPCGEGLIWDADLAECLPDVDLPDVPDVLDCMEGFQWSDLYEECVPIGDLPDVVECMEGWEWSDLYGKCVEKLDSVDVVECMEGWEWSDLYGKCVEKLDSIDAVECMEGWEWSDLYGKCVEKIESIDAVECMEGWEWSDLYGKCVEKLDSVDVVECMEGWEWSDLYGKCVEKIESIDAVECMEGWEWSDLYGECIEKINDDTQCPEGWVSENGHCVEINLPDVEVPDGPSAPKAKGGTFTPKWSPLFEAGTVDVYKAPPQRSLFKDYL